MKLSTNSIALILGLAALSLAPSAKAACGSRAARTGLALSSKAKSAAAPGAESPANPSIVGLWDTTFLLGQGPLIWDEGFEQWHSDGTELNVDNAVPPSLGNVCVGVYKQSGPRTYKLRHVTWNWDEFGNRAGTFLLLMTVTTDARGNTFAGTYVSDSFDLDGNVIPALHAEGVVNGIRITVD
jgi:hypothetical protein